MTPSQLSSSDEYCYLHSACDITTLSKKDQIIIIDKLLEKLKETKNDLIVKNGSLEYNKLTPICILIQNCNIDVIEHLIEKFAGCGKDIFTKCGENSDHPIHIAASVGSIEIIELLFKNDVQNDGKYYNKYSNVT
jgi:hypothetical protein